MPEMTDLCAVCSHPYGDHYTTNDGAWSGCDAERDQYEELWCGCKGFAHKPEG